MINYLFRDDIRSLRHKETAKQKVMLWIYKPHFLIFSDGTNDFFVQR